MVVVVTGGGGVFSVSACLGVVGSRVFPFLFSVGVVSRGFEFSSDSGSSVEGKAFELDAAAVSSPTIDERSIVRVQQKPIKGAVHKYFARDE